MSNRNIDQMSENEILAIQESRFDKFLLRVGAYPDFLKLYPQVTAMGGLQDLGKLPILTQAFLISNSPPLSKNMYCRSSESGVVLASGGTSGERKTVIHSWKTFSDVMQMGARGLARRLGRKPKKIANCFLPGSLWGGFLFGNGMAEALDAMLFPIGRPPISEICQIICDNQIDCFFASPSFAYYFLLNEEVDAAKLASLTDFCYVGENLNPIQVERIQKKLPNLKIHSLAYTTNETGTIGYQCPDQSGGFHHIHEDFVHVEVVDPATGVNVDEGELGEILVTLLDADSVPLLRYQVGDVVRLGGRTCACGSNTRVIELIGRASASANIIGTTLYIEQFVRAISPLGGYTVQDIQVQTYVRQGKTYFNVALASTVQTAGTPAKFEAYLRQDSLIDEIVKEPQCGGMKVKFIDPCLFAISNRTGKIPSFVDIEETAS